MNGFNALAPSRANHAKYKRNRERAKRRLARELADLVEHAARPAAAFDGARNVLGGRLNGFRGVVNRLGRFVEYRSGITVHLELVSHA